MDPASFKTFSNYVALPPIEAFRIEYWAMEEAKLRRQPPEKELSRRIALVVGGGSGIGREVAHLAAARGAHVMIADYDEPLRPSVADELSAPHAEGIRRIDHRRHPQPRTRSAKPLAPRSPRSAGSILSSTLPHLFPSSPDGHISDDLWSATLNINVTANYILADEAAKLFAEQDLDGSIVLTSSANAVVPKRGSEAYDVSKAALSHLVRELAVSLAPKVRVNAVSPATVVKGSTMFPRDRVRASLAKYNIAFDETKSDDELRALARRALRQAHAHASPIDPADCAEAILFLASPKTHCTTGHIFPVDGGLTEAFLR